MRRGFRVACGVFAACCASGVAHGAPLNTWGAHVGDGVAGTTMYVYGRDAFAGSRFVNPVVYGEFGVGAYLEIDVGVGGVAGDGGGARASLYELMARAFVAPSTALVLHGIVERTSETVTVGPELHGVYDLPADWDLTVNALWAPRVGPGAVSPGLVALTVAPEYYFAPGFSSFLEVVAQGSLDDVRAPNGGRFYAELVPGVAMRFGAMHEVCTGLGVPVAGASLAGAYVGVWYSVASSGLPVRIP
jgi:hypothetical protein